MSIVKLEPVNEEVLATAEPVPVHRVHGNIGKTGNAFIEEALHLPKPPKLIGNYVLQTPGAYVFFGRAGVGKSFFAVQAADAIAAGRDIIETPDGLFKNETEPQPVLYVDRELNTRQFKNRRENANGVPIYLSDNFHRLVPSYEIEEEEEDCLQAIVEYSNAYNCKVVFLDNLSTLGKKLKDAQVAYELLKKFKTIAERHSITFIMVTHTPKVNDFEPLTLDNIAGSSQIGVVIEGAFAINKLPYSKGFYLRHVKNRNGKEEEGYQIIELAEPTLSQPLTVIHKKKAKYRDIFGRNAMRNAEIIQLKEEGFSYSEIVEKLQVSKGLAHKVVKAYEEEGGLPF